MALTGIVHDPANSAVHIALFLPDGTYWLLLSLDHAYAGPTRTEKEAYHLEDITVVPLELC